MISREELDDWLDSCPCEEWFIASEEEGLVRIAFCFEIEENDDE